MATPDPAYVHPEALATSEWLAAHLHDPSVRVVDARFDLRAGSDGSLEPHPEREAYTAGHVPGAVFLDVMGDLSDPDDPMVVPTPERFEALMADLGIGNDTTVVVYDAAGGTWGARLWWALRYHGHDAVKILDGGFPRWAGEGRPVDDGSVEPVAGSTFRATIRPHLRVTADDVQAAIGDPATCIVDALPAVVYSGEMRLYPTHRAGHIAGAVNLPAPSNLDPATMTLLPPADLARLWEPVQPGPDRPVIAYCGGGVYAAFALFSLYLLGHENGALYDASWSEWGADPHRPVETGP